MTVRMKKSKYFVLALIITCLMVACVAPAAYAIVGIDDAVIGSVIASCAMFGVQWAIREGAQALSRADIVQTVRSKLLTSGFTESDLLTINNAVKHPAQGIFTLPATLFKRLAGFASDLSDEVDASASGSVSVGNAVNTVSIAGYDFTLPIDTGLAIEYATNLGVFTYGELVDLRVDGEGLYTDLNGNGSYYFIYLVKQNPYHKYTLGQFGSSSYFNDGNAHTLYVDMRPSYWGVQDDLAFYCSDRAHWSTTSKPTNNFVDATLAELLAGDYNQAGVSLNVRKVVPDKPLPDLELLPDTGEVSVSTGLDFTDGNGLVDAMVNAVNGIGSYIPVYDYSDDINDLTTATNGVLGNTTGILSGVQSIAGTLTEVLTAVKSILLSAFDFLASLPGYLASFAGKFAGIWHYVVSWVGSLGSFASFVFGVWGNLPYAMLVPVYASAVIVLVVFVFKRFFG